jgi:hypothetical protein
MGSKYKIDIYYEELIGSLIVSQYKQSSYHPHQTCPRSPRGPPQAPHDPRAPGESTPEDAPPRAASLQPEPDSPLAARLSRAAQS